MTEADPVETFLAIGLIGAWWDFPAVLLAIPLEHLVLDFSLDRFAILRNGPFYWRRWEL